jgi:YHS domain-containing protein
MIRKCAPYLIAGLLGLVLVVTLTDRVVACGCGNGPLLASAAEQTGEPQKYCPITGEKIDKSVYLDHEGKRVYLCCAACKDAFLKDPKKHIQAMESKGITLEKSPKAADKPAPEAGGKSGY